MQLHLQALRKKGDLLRVHFLPLEIARTSGLLLSKGGGSHLGPIFRPFCPACPIRKNVKLEEKNIYRLFFSVLEDAAQNTDTVREVFSVLVKSTLRYRDHMLESEGIVITVKDVRIALEWLVPSLKTGRLPKTNNKIRLNLLKIWLDELKHLGNPNVYLC